MRCFDSKLKIRPKLFLLFFGACIAPLLFLCALNYVSDVRNAEAELRSNVEEDATGLAQRIESSLHEQRTALIALARSSALRDYVRGGREAQQKPEQSAASAILKRPRATAVSQISKNSGAAATATTIATAPRTSNDVPPEVRATVGTFLNRKFYAAITCLNAARQTLFRAEPNVPGIIDASGSDGAEVNFQTKDFLSNMAGPDERVWMTKEPLPLGSMVEKESSGAILRYTVPVFMAAENNPPTPRGALVVDVKFDALCKDAAGGDAAGTLATLPVRRALERPGAPPPPRIVIVLDHSGNIIYHTNDALLYKPAAGVMPASFTSIADAMTAGEQGWKFFDAAEGTRFLAQYRPVAPQQGTSIAVAGNYSASLDRARRALWIGVALSSALGALMAMLLLRIAGRKVQSLEHVTQGAAAIAGGKLDQRIEVRSSDDTRLLADSVNAMTDRLREQLAREAETRQFESFVRLSAMLTHDLKNAIAGLSLLVNNMKRQFHREEFRADAMQSLTEATQKLSTLVAKLSAPVQTLSGEYKLPRPLDLVPVIKRVLAAHQDQHEIEMRLPEELTAIVDAERIEKIFENLVLNAIEAMGATRGQLTVEAGVENDHEIFFSVADTGPGISEFQRQRLFQPFATTKKKGVGLGLYTVREVVSAHGGRLDVQSQEGAGACFRVVLPSTREV